MSEPTVSPVLCPSQFPSPPPLCPLRSHQPMCFPERGFFGYTRKRFFFSSSPHEFSPSHPTLSFGITRSAILPFSPPVGHVEGRHPFQVLFCTQTAQSESSFSFPLFRDFSESFVPVFPFLLPLFYPCPFSRSPISALRRPTLMPLRRRHPPPSLFFFCQALSPVFLDDFPVLRDLFFFSR